MPIRIDDYQRIRVVLDIAAKTGPVTDVLSGGPARFARGSLTRFEFLLMSGRQEMADPSQISAARLRLLSTSDPDSALGMDKVIGQEGMNAGISLEDWETGDPNKCHLRFEFTASEAAEGVFAGSPLDDGDFAHWFILTHGAANTHLYAHTLFSFDAGLGTAGVPPVTGSAATLEQIKSYVDAVLGGYVKFVGNPAGRTIELPAPTSGKSVKLGCDDNGDFQTGTQTDT